MEPLTKSIIFLEKYELSKYFNKKSYDTKTQSVFRRP